MKKHIIFCLFLLFASSLYSQDNTFPFLDTKAIGAYDFINKNPEYDGRNVIIFVLDNAVDPSIPGLIKTSEGKHKLIDMQDFSNQLVLNLKESEIEKDGAKEYLKAGDIRISGYENLKYKPKDGKYYYGIIDEKKNFRNSTVNDLNSNGKTDDKFAIISFKIEITNDILSDMKGFVKPKAGSEQWVYYIDENSNGNISEETPRFNYKYNYDYFDFFTGEKGKRPVVVMSANISPDSKRMVINTCDGSHGSHCAGIASGYEIYNQKGYNGIAPGAYVSSLKIGSNLLSGGATTTESMKKAYEYAVEFMKESGIKYGVFSMSYGIGSEQPGRSAIDKFLDKFVLKNPNIVVVTSNGNSGPGINSTGNPAGANNIISVGAMLPVDVLKNLYGSQRNKAWVTHFSSRGGESNKPDVVAPGGASSSVPNFETGDAFWGTSMACPEVAGACAVLFSAAEHNNIEVNGSMIKKAIKYTAKSLDGYLNVDQGFGLVNIPSAFEYLKVLSERKEYEKVAGYIIETDNTFYPNNKGEVAFWKAGGYFPKKNEKQDVIVKAQFYDNLPKEAQHNFYRSYKLSSDAAWLKTDKDEIYIRGEMGAKFSLIYDNSKLTKPGIYEARITAKPKGEQGSNYTDFDVLATVVIPYKFSAENNYSIELKSQKLAIGDLSRIFFDVPVGASMGIIKISNVEGKNFDIGAYLFDPEGMKIKTSDPRFSKPKNEFTFYMTPDILKNGTWELLPFSNYQALSDVYYNVSIQFFTITSDKKMIDKLNFDAGENPKGDFSLINNSNNTLNINLSGAITGYTNMSKISNKGSSVFNKTFKISDDIKSCVFKVKMDNEEFNKTTDIAFNIFDKDGQVVKSDGFSRKNGEVSFYPTKGGEYRIEIEAGFTNKEFEYEPWEFDFTEEYYFSNATKLNFGRYDSRLFPNIWKKINFTCESQLYIAPSGYSTFGKIYARDDNKNTVFEQKIILK